MNTSETIFYIIIVVILGTSLYYYMTRTKEAFDLKCIVSTTDGQKYCVRDRDKLHEAVDLLAEAANNCEKLVKYVDQRYPDDPRVQQLSRRFDKKVIMETLPTSEYTAYTENKGEEVAFCLNKKKDNDEDLIDNHTLTFVAIHELAHIMTLTTGHEQDFWENFKWLLEAAKKAGIHDPENYEKSPVEYCGMKIEDNPYYR